MSKKASQETGKAVMHLKDLDYFSGKPGVEFFLEQWAVVAWYEPGLFWGVGEKGPEESTSIVFFLYLHLFDIFLTTEENEMLR